MDTKTDATQARIRRAVKARGHFPHEQAALKCVYLAIMSLGPTGPRPSAVDDPLETCALNAFEMAFDGRLAAGRK